MVGPYREASVRELLEAPTREGLARLEIGPRWLRLEIAGRVVVGINERWLTLAGTERRLVRARSMSLTERRLVAARSVPTEDLALWYEGTPGIVTRVIGLRPIELLDAAAMRAWHRFDLLARRLAEALEPFGLGATRSWELGNGQHRVLLVAHPDRMLLFARPLFRERPRRMLEVRADGTVMLATREGDRSIRCRQRCGVTVLGDRLRFEADNGHSVASAWLPWISSEDRAALSDRFGSFVESNSPHARLAARA